MRKVYFLFSLCLLSACGAEKPVVQELAHEQKSQQVVVNTAKHEIPDPKKVASQKYREAIMNHQEKMRPIADYINKVCMPKSDKKYISCVNEKQSEIIANSLFPDLESKMFEKLYEYQQQLVKKKITRQKFNEESEKLGRELSDKVNDRALNDIKAGIYSGKI